LELEQTLVLTGGPSGGKTTLALMLTRAFLDRVAMVPESASLLFAGGFHRVNDPVGVRHQQAAIYRVQVEHEAIFRLEYPSRMLICDRGTLDGCAYWPEGGQDFFSVNGTRLEDELARYTWVIHLETATAGGYNDNANPLRRESAEEASLLNKKVLDVWRKHPQRFIIPNARKFTKKVSVALDIMEQIFSGTSFENICKRLAPEIK
jgi:hypothetical protein